MAHQLSQGSSHSINTGLGTMPSQWTWVAWVNFTNLNGPPALWRKDQNSSPYIDGSFSYSTGSSAWTLEWNYSTTWASYQYSHFGNGSDVHLALSWDQSTAGNAPTLYYDGSSQTPSSSQASAGTRINRSSVDLYFFSGLTFALDFAPNADVWDMALFDRILTQGEIDALAAGVSPLLIPAGLIIYIPAMRSTLIDVMGQNSLSASTGGVTTNRRIFLPARAQRWPAAVQTLTAPLLDVSPTILAPTLEQVLSVSSVVDVAPSVLAASLEQVLGASTVDVAPTLQAPSLALSLDAPLLDVAASIAAASVSYQLDAPLLDVSPTILAPSTALQVSAPLLDVAPALPSPAMALQVDAALVDVAATFFSPTLQVANRLVVPLLDVSPTVSAPAVAQALTAPLIDVGAQPLAPSLALAVDAPVLDGAPTFFTPSLELSLGAPALDASPAFFSPTMLWPRLAPVVDVSPTFFAPTIQAVRVLTAGLVDLSAAFFAPTLIFGAVGGPAPSAPVVGAANPGDPVVDVIDSPKPRVSGLRPGKPTVK